MGDILFTLASGLLINEFCDVSPWMAKRLVSTAARRAYADEILAKARAEEWQAIIDERPGKLFKLCTGIMFAVGAVASVSRRVAVREASSAVASSADALVRLARLGSRSLVVYRFLLVVASRMGSAPARALLGQLLEMSGDLDGALENYRIAFEQGIGEVWPRLGGLLEWRTETEDAIDVYRRAIPYGGYLARAELLRLLERVGRASEAIGLWDASSGEARIANRELRIRASLARVKQSGRRRRNPQEVESISGLWGTRLLVGNSFELEGRVADALKVYRENSCDIVAMKRAEELIDRYWTVTPDDISIVMSEGDVMDLLEEAYSGLGEYAQDYLSPIFLTKA